MKIARILLLVVLAACAREPQPAALETANQALAELRATAMREVKDSERAKQAAGLVDELEALLATVDADMKAHHARIQALNADYDATEGAFRAAFRDFNAKRDARQDRLIDINRRGKALLSAEEWKTLGRVRAEALERIVKTATEG